MTYHDMVYADQQSGLNAAGDGDSGGPVYSISADDQTSVWAKGTITGGGGINFPATCTGDPASDTRQCSSRVWYTDIVESLHYFGADIVIG